MTTLVARASIDGNNASYTYTADKKRKLLCVATGTTGNNQQHYASISTTGKLLASKTIDADAGQRKNQVCVAFIDVEKDNKVSLSGGGTEYGTGTMIVLDIS